jgi:streptogrisin C
VDLHMWSNNYPTDGALMPYVTSPQNYAVYWKPNNWVIAGSNTQFPIRGSYTYDQIGVGWAVCMDGATSGHRCGHVTGKAGGIITDICEQHGDSGGPLFSEVDNKAYGMVDWDTTTDNSCPSGYRSYHTAIQSLYNYAWGYQHITFKVKTS